ncbi:hypothetical protein UlMin_033971 [Ulmus minor]
MASRNTCHVRSNSFPSRSHPLSSRVEEQLCSLRSFSEATTSSSSSSLCNRLSGLKDLQESIDSLLQLQQTQQALSREENNICVEQVLDGSLRVLDVCGITRDVFSQMNQCLQELQSSLRRRKAESSLENEISAYMISKKKLTKMISTRVGNLKTMKKNCTSENSEISMLIEVEEITMAAFQSLLSFISQPKSTKSIVLKMFQSKRVSCEGLSCERANEVEKVEAKLVVLKSSKNISVTEVQKLLKRLEAIESNIQELEEELECVFRCLMKTRVSLLNIFNH